MKSRPLGGFFCGMKKRRKQAVSCRLSYRLMPGNNAKVVLRQGWILPQN